VVCAARAAGAAEVTRVLAGAQAGRWPDVHLSVAWLHESRRAAIRRELESQATGGQIALRDDLVYHQTRDVLRLRAEVGLWRGLGLAVTLPLVLADDRSLDFDRPVDESSSTMLRDGILPGFGLASYGLDARHARPFTRPSPTVFRGPTRKGVEYLGVGLGYALLDQARQPHQPTWIVRLESRFAVGTTRRFDPARPGANTGVSPGYHELWLSTAFSRRFGGIEPHLGAFYALPAGTGGSPVDRNVLGRSAALDPQRRAGAHFGVEAVLWDDPRSRRRITFDLTGRLELRTFGLEQGPLWEPLSGASTCPRERATCRAIDADTNADAAPDPHPGTTRAPAHGRFGGDAGLYVQAGRFVLFRALFGLTFEEAHLLSDGGSGNEVHDIPGRRFRLEEGRRWHLLVDGGVLF
jgi:hypothetical protein